MSLGRLPETKETYRMKRVPPSSKRKAEIQALLRGGAEAGRDRLHPGRRAHPSAIPAPRVESRAGPADRMNFRCYSTDF